MSVILKRFPNLEAIVEGRVSGNVSEWIAIRTEIERLVDEADHWCEEYARMSKAAYENAITALKTADERDVLKSGTSRPLWAQFVEEARVELEDRTDHLPTRVRNALGYLRQAAECHKPNCSAHPLAHLGEPYDCTRCSPSGCMTPADWPNCYTPPSTEGCQHSWYQPRVRIGEFCSKCGAKRSSERTD